MKFSEWKLLEMISRGDLKKEAEKVKEIIAQKYNSLYHFVPDFNTFTRPGEPEQKSILFTEDGSTSFSLNFTTKGDIFSIDVYKETADPIVTYYVERGSLEDVAVMAPEILKNPKKTPGAIKPKKKVLQEDVDEEPKLTPSEPKPETSLDPEVKKAEKIENEYDYSDPETIFEDLKSYVEMVIKGTQPSLLITGSPGAGKTYSVLKQVKDAGLEKGKDYVHIKGRGTAAGLFISLYDNNGKLIIFDDCDSIFGPGDAVNILKGALDSYEEREISWLVGKPLVSDGKKLPKTFTFTGRVIFISNLPQRKIDDAIKSRSFMIEVALTPEDMIKKMKKELPMVYPEVPLYLREEAMDTIEDVYKNAKNLELNMRTLVKAIKILREIPDLKVARRLILQQCSYK
jgi:hypothetical protein